MWNIENVLNVLLGFGVYQYPTEGFAMYTWMTKIHLLIHILVDPKQMTRLSIQSG